MSLKKSIHGNCRKIFTYILTISSIILCSNITGVYALDPGDEQSIKDLKAKGKFDSSLKNAVETGNHNVDPYLVEKLKVKLKRASLISQCLP